jgi:hypothetical protein
MAAAAIVNEVMANSAAKVGIFQIGGIVTCGFDKTLSMELK